MAAFRIRSPVQVFSCTALPVLQDSLEVRINVWPTTHSQLFLAVLHSKKKKKRIKRQHLKKRHSVTLTKWRQKLSGSLATSNHICLWANTSLPWSYHWMDGTVPTSLCHQPHSLLVSLICPSPFSLSPSLTHPPPLSSFSSTHPVHIPSITLILLWVWH